MDARHSGPSDLESVKTEDFENQFHSLMVKRVSPTHATYHQSVDSDLDTMRTQMIHDQFQSALSKIYTFIFLNRNTFKLKKCYEPDKKGQFYGTKFLFPNNQKFIKSTNPESLSEVS